MTRGYLITDAVERGADEAGLADWERIAVDAVGQVIDFWGFKRNQGRVWALLYLRRRALSAAEIQAALGLSKGAVSMVTRELERWGVVHRVRPPDIEVWQFSAEESLMEMVRRVIAQREANLVSRVRADLAEAERRAAASRTARSDPRALDRLRRMRVLADLVHRSLSIFLKTARLDATSALGALGGDRGRRPGKRTTMERGRKR